MKAKFGTYLHLHGLFIGSGRWNARFRGRCERSTRHGHHCYIGQTRGILLASLLGTRPWEEKKIERKKVVIKKHLNKSLCVKQNTRENDTVKYYIASPYISKSFALKSVLRKKQQSKTEEMRNKISI